MLDRRTFLQRTAALSVLSCLPLQSQALFAAAQGGTDFTITELEILKLSANREITRGLNRQHQVQPLHLYEDRRPAVYRDNPKTEHAPLTQYYLRIRTRGGAEGLYGMVDKEALPTILGPLRTLLLGQDALAIERLWDQMYRSNRHARASHYMMGISYVDNALWDLRARYFGVPVYRLLGGPTQHPVRVYGSCLGFSIEPEAAAKRAAQLKADGYLHQKWFLGYGPSDGAHGMNMNVELVRALRAAVGEDVALLFDAYQGWDLQYSIEWCRRVEQYHPYFLEEAVLVADLESFARLSKLTSIPIATGEHFYNRWEIEQFLKADALQYIQADPEWCGGVSELIKICALASVHGVKVIPHCHNVHAALHVVASQSPAVCPMGEYLINYVPEKLFFMKNAFAPKQGLVTLPQGPGFGIELDDAKIEQREVLTSI
jgi:L-rhamnonate dehydratase